VLEYISTRGKEKRRYYEGIYLPKHPRKFCLKRSFINTNISDSFNNLTINETEPVISLG